MIQLVASLIVRNDKGQILMGRKAEYPHRYCTPGGKVEDGEKVEVAAVRELLEEAAIWATQLRFLGYVEPKKKFVVIFEVVSWEGQICNREPHKCKGWEWKDEIPDDSVEGLIIWRNSGMNGNRQSLTDLPLQLN